MASLVIWLLFFLSGACGLVYEVLWTRHLGLILGNTTQSLAAVLSAFMGGLALGSFLGGRYVARRKTTARLNLLGVYGLLEIAIGLYCLALPLLFEAAAPLYEYLYGETGSAAIGPARFMVSFLFLLVPTTCMGATFPLLSEHLADSARNMSRVAGGLYAVNTFGAVVGAAATGFIFLPELGRSTTNLIAVACNLLLGAVAVVVGRNSAAHRTTNTATQATAATQAASGTDTGLTPATMKLVMLVFGLTGFAAMATQIAWTRALTLAIGSSTYAFSLIVAIFILGLALGGAGAARLASRLKDPLGTLAQTLGLIGLLCMALVALLGWGPTLFFWLIAYGSQWSFPVLLAIQALGIAVLLGGPTVLMGATLPLTLQVVQARAEQPGGVGRTVATLYAANTLGAILGSLIGGLALLPVLQIQRTLQVTAWLYALPGLLLFLRSSSRQAPRSRALMGMLFVGVLALSFLPAWDPMQMGSGAYLLREPQKVKLIREGRWSEALPTRPGTAVLYYKEGVSATVSVMKTPVGITLAVGGKPDASSGGNDMTTQLGLTLIPALIQPKAPETVLVIGMGSGISLGAVLALPSVQRADVVEISPEVMEASRFFSDFSGLRYEERGGTWALVAPRTEVILNDGRNHLRLTSRRYDLISSEPSNPWIAGIGNLFTQQAFELARDRLNEGGVFCQWLHRYGMGEAEFRSVLATFVGVFPHVQFWCVYPGSDYLLIGSRQPLRIAPAALAARMAPAPVQALLQKVNFHLPEEFLANCMCDTEGMRQFGAGAVIHTDDNMLLEFAAPRTQHQHKSLFPVTPWRVATERVLDLSGLEARDRRAFLRQLDLSVTGHFCLDRTGDWSVLRADLRAAARLFAPHVAWVAGPRQETERDPDSSLPLDEQEVFSPLDLDTVFENLARLDKPNAAARRKLAWVCEQRAALNISRRQFVAAELDLQRATAADSDGYRVALLTARMLGLKGAVDESMRRSKQAEDLGAPGHEVMEEVVRAMLQGKRHNDAVNFFERIFQHPDSSQPRFGVLMALYARCLEQSGQRAAARTKLIEALRLNAGIAEAQRLRAELALSSGQPSDRKEAENALTSYRASFPPLDAESYEIWASLELRVAALIQNSGEEAAALEYLRRARRAAYAATVIAPLSVEPWALLARALKSLGDEDGASEATQTAERLRASKQGAP